MAGTFLFFLITAISCSVIWRIDVEGNHYISDEYIKEVLGEVGFSVGDKIKEKNIDIINNRFLTVSKGIRWISVNLNGTYANVEVRETDEGGTEQDGKIYNLVASEDGQIERMASIEGKPQVVINDTVEKGDVLVSGVINYHENLMRFESAKGSVFAKVSRKFDVEVPVEKEIKEYTGEQKCDRVINFFENRINLIKNSRIPYKFYDTIEKNREMTVFSQVLPISVKVTEYREYVTEKIVLNEKKAKEEALSQYRQKLTETIGRDALLSKTVNSSFDGKTYRIHCEVYCLADIAYPSEIKITERADKIGTENGKTALR